MPGPGSVAIPKPKKRAKVKRAWAWHKRMKRTKKKSVTQKVKAVRPFVFARERSLGGCRVCGCAPESMHEMRSAGATGSRLDAVSVENSIAVCGSGTTKCHGLLTANIVKPQRPADAQKVLEFVLDGRRLRHPEVVALLARRRPVRMTSFVISDEGGNQ